MAWDLAEGETGPIRTGQVIEFDYLNWRGEPHHYAVVIESVEWAFLDEEGRRAPVLGELTIVVNGWVINRDGDLRPDMGENRRRTFRVSGMEHAEVSR